MVRLVSKNSLLVVAATAVGEVTALQLADLAVYILLSECQQTQVQVQTDHQHGYVHLPVKALPQQMM